MSDQEFSTPRPLVLRVEISAEQAASLAPLLGSEIVGGSDLGQESTYGERRPQPISDYAADAPATQLKRLETDPEQPETEVEARGQFPEDRIQRGRTELEK